jgi:hypothetical protein
VDGVDGGRTAPPSGARACGRRPPGSLPADTLPGMVVEVVPAQLYALSGVLDAASGRMSQCGAAVVSDGVGGPSGAGVADVTETLRTAANCLAGELGWLAGAVTAAADAWLGLDGSLLPRVEAAVAQ